MSGQQQQQQDGGSRRSTEPRILEWDGPGPLPAIPNINYAVFMLESMAAYGDAVAVEDADTRQHWKYSELCSAVPRVSGGLAKAGVTRGEVVLLLMPTHMDFPLILLSILHCGAVCVPVNPLYSPEELVHVLNVSEARWAVVHPDVAPAAEAAFSLLPHGTLKKMWVLGNDSTRPCIAHLMTHDPVPPSTKAEGLDWAKTVALLPTSSGTTGLPKAVMVTHRNLLINPLRDQYMHDVDRETSVKMRELRKRQLLVLPVCHVYGIVVVTRCLLAGGTTIFLSKFSPKRYFEIIQDFKVTASPLVPHLIDLVANTPLRQQYDLSSFKVFGISGAPISADSVTSVVRKMGLTISSGYGLTEAFSPVTNCTSDILVLHPDSVGKVVSYIQVKFVDVKTGRMVGERQEGEVCVRGPSIMLGYANNPTATASTIDPYGWLHTGDVGYYDQDNFVYLTSRIKDLIKVKGYQMPP